MKFENPKLQEIANIIGEYQMTRAMQAIEADLIKQGVVDLPINIYYEANIQTVRYDFEVGGKQIIGGVVVTPPAESDQQ